jgi:hypothetical protein
VLQAGPTSSHSWGLASQLKTACQPSVVSYVLLTTRHQAQVTVGERPNYVELLSAAQCDPENGRDWKTFPVLSRGSSLFHPVIHYFPTLLSG